MNILNAALTPKRVLLIGAGKAAALKAKSVCESDCFLVVKAREIKDSYFEKIDTNIDIKIGDFLLEDTRGFDIVINASGDLEISKLLWRERKNYGFLLNSVDMPDLCDFYFTASFRDHDLCIGVSTGGASPSYAQKIRDLIKAVIPRKTKEFYAKLKDERGVKDRQNAGKTYLIGCGTGRKEKLTIKAINALQEIDVALIDALVGKEIVDLLPSRCQKIAVSKQKGCHTFTQDEINSTLLKYAKKGLIVGRLKGGDPAVFGRVFEEASFLRGHNIEVETISGVSSAFAACLEGGIAPTLRGISTGVLIVSAHLRETIFNDDWIELLKNPQYTIIVLMAYSFAEKIVDKALEIGVDMSLSAAFVSKIDSAEQKTVIGGLGKLKEMAKLCDKPAVLIIGKAIAEADKMPFNGERIILT